MCYINGVRVTLAQYIEYKRTQKELASIQIALMTQPARKGFDYGDWPVIKPAFDGKDWDVVAMEWGFVPNYVRNADGLEKFRRGYKEPSGKFHPPLTTLNSMGEEMIKPRKMFREAGLKRRCLVLSSGFYEHRHVFPLNKRTGLPLKTANKYPYHITVKDKPVFMMAGIYNSWVNEDTGEVKDTFAIITTKANELMSQVHNSKERMPVIFTDDLADKWTDPNLTEAEIIELATFQFPASHMTAHTVAKNFLENVDPTEEFIYPELELLT